MKSSSARREAIGAVIVTEAAETTVIKAGPMVGSKTGRAIGGADGLPGWLPS